MKISLVTLSFNQKIYLREALESVLSQEYPDLEYIVVDPGSTDGSQELISSYSDRIAHIVFERDQGAADGLNKGFSRATGDVFGFLNSDDLLLPGALQLVADFFNKHPEIDMAMGNGFKIDDQGKKLRHFRARNFTTRRYLYGGTRWLQQSTFVRADAYRSSPKFNVENRTCWDGELFVNIANQGAKVGYIDADLGTFRIHGASISGSGKLNEQYKRDCRRIFRQIRGRKWGIGDEFLRFLYRLEGLLIRLGSGVKGTMERGFL
jgi:glycosyltransferase involved in cell wall biosynthesis